MPELLQMCALSLQVICDASRNVLGYISGPISGTVTFGDQPTRPKHYGSEFPLVSQFVVVVLEV
jgi:hypothetical protein